MSSRISEMLKISYNSLYSFKMLAVCSATNYVFIRCPFQAQMLGNERHDHLLYTTFQEVRHLANFCKDFSSLLG